MGHSAKDTPYPGPINLEVDLRDTARGILAVRQSFPVQPGPLALLYPEWIPGFHAPSAPIGLLAGLIFKADGRELSWHRKDSDVFAFHLAIPDAVSCLTAHFQFLSPPDEEYGRVSITPSSLMLQWNTVVLYPAGYYSRQIQVCPSALLPPGWEYACAINAEPDGDRLKFDQTALDRLVDSPLLSGKHLKRLPLDDSGAVSLHIVADNLKAFDITEDRLIPHRALIQQCDRLFGCRHFDRYDFLLALSDAASPIAVEHRCCCEIATSSSYFTDWETSLTVRTLFAHEYIHSWNGKYCRGEDSWTPSYDQPVGNSLMWVYEGLTQYLSEIVSVRAGLWSQQNGRDSLAITAARLLTREGRAWRPLADTMRDPVLTADKSLPWISWQRGGDYYQEGMMIWLEVDMLLRTLSGGSLSLDDFIRDFFGGRKGSSETLTYKAADIATALNRLVSYDWEAFFRDRLDSINPPSPLKGLELGGYALVFKAAKSVSQSQEERRTGRLDLSNSIGIQVEEAGNISEVVWNSAAFHAGVLPGSKLISVRDQPFSFRRLEDAVASPSNGEHLTFELESRGTRATRSLNYDGGNRFPHLAPVTATPLLDAIFEPLL